MQTDTQMQICRLNGGGCIDMKNNIQIQQCVYSLSRCDNFIHVTGQWIIEIQYIFDACICISYTIPMEIMAFSLFAIRYSLSLQHLPNDFIWQYLSFGRTDTKAIILYITATKVNWTWYRIKNGLTLYYNDAYRSTSVNIMLTVLLNLSLFSFFF